MLYNLIKEYYDMGLYTKAQLRVFVQAQMLTPEQYTLICGEPYDEPTSTAPQSQASAAPSQASTAISAAPTASTAI